ncbi:MAG: hypothetical protein ABGZ35_07685 [Planctomycetaceae bacterium]|jgi:hypothetical protein
MSLSRRGFLAGVAGTLPLANSALAVEQRRPRIAAVTTIYHKYSHSQHIVDRFLEGYGWEGRHHRPSMDIVSLYVEQVGDNDLSRDRASHHPQMKIYPTIAEALTRGGDSLAVDGVLLIGEHGKYPDNEKGQRLYPRYEYFQQIVDVYRQSGRTAPVFNDKHLSWNWEWAKKMVDTSREMDFGFMAGSSLPVARRLPSMDLPMGADVEEVIGVWAGGIDGGDIHVLEAMQSIVERRRGGETGVRAVEALRGDRFWNALESGSWERGGFDRRLLEAVFARSNTINPVRPNWGVVFPTIEDMRRLAPASYAYRFEYLDGMKATIVQFQGRPGQENAGVVGDCTVAARLKGGRMFSVLVYLPYYSMRNFFNPQVHHIESLFHTGKSPYPIERTLLTTGMTAAGIESLFQKQQRIETPHLAIQYEPTPASTFWRT